jgi:hypothetical protein
MAGEKNPYEWWIWCIVTILVIVTCLLGMWGFAIAYNKSVPLSLHGISGAFSDNSLGPQGDTPNRSLDFLYKSLQLFTLGSGATIGVNNWQLETARFLAPILTLSSILIVFLALLDRSRFFRLFFNPGHVVICGCGYLGPAIARHYSRKEKRLVVIIEKDPDNPALDTCRAPGVIIITGDATQKAALRQARIFAASEIFVVTGNDDTNAEIAVLCENIAAGKKRWRDRVLIKTLNMFPLTGLRYRPGPPHCHIHFEDALLSKTFGLSHPVLKAHLVPQEGDSPIMMEFFNLYRIAGYCVQRVEPRPFTGTEIRLGVHPHLMVIGFGRMGENLIVQAVKRWRAEKYKDKLIITVVSRNAKKHLAEMRTWYPSLDRYCTITAVDEDTESLGLHELQEVFREFGEPVSRIYICSSNSLNAMSIALLLIEKMEFEKIPIIVRSLYEDGLTHVIQSFKKQGSYHNIHPFPIIESPCCMELITGGMLDALAKVIHEDYVRKQLSRTKGPGTPADPALCPWSELDEHHKEANRLLAMDIRRKLNTIRYDIAPLTEWKDEPVSFSATETEYLAKKEHERWMKAKREAGYVPGRESSDTLKTSPWFIPYNQLPWEEQEKDRNIIRNIPSLLERVDLRIVRNSALFRYELARRIQENYIEQNKEKAVTGQPDPALKPWDQLDESFRQSNIEQADDIFNKLRSIGCDVFYAGTTEEPIFTFTDEEIETLAFREHDRWVKERINNGWVYGTEKDVGKKTSPYLIPYNEISDDIREKDRGPVREIPGLLASVGLQIVRNDAGNPEPGPRS